MAEEIQFFICQVCFETSVTEDECHGTMIACCGGDWGDARRKPIRNNFGKYVDRAPLWFHQATTKLSLEDILQHRKEKK